MIDLRKGDCLEVMKGMADNSVDSIVTDPPYELGFMGKSWDSTGIANNVDMWGECLRVLKPGGYLLSFSATRTYHRMAVAIEDAGFEIRDMIEWVYGSGFPKSHDISKAIDKMAGAERKVMGENPYNKIRGTGSIEDSFKTMQGKSYITAPATPEAIQWNGWGTALKPAHEPICMARKPISEKTVAKNCLKWGTGGINIDKSRVVMSPEDKEMLDAKASTNNNGVNFDVGEGKAKGTATPANNLGRFPANLIHDNSEEVRECFPETKSGKATVGTGKGFAENASSIASTGIITSCFADSGNASRFFKSIIYQPKASKAERNKGVNNFHPTVKPVKLMEYLIEMVAPENGTVLDPFMGSGTTGVACVNTNRNFIGIEMDDKYFEIAEKRINDAIIERQSMIFKDTI